MVGCINLPFAAIHSDVTSIAVCHVPSPVMVSSHLVSPPFHRQGSAGATDIAMSLTFLQHTQKSIISALMGCINLPSVPAMFEVSPTVHQDSCSFDLPSSDVNLPVSALSPTSSFSDDTVSWVDSLDHDFSVHVSNSDVMHDVMDVPEKLSVKVCDG